jgi:predicted amidohydrolase
MLPDKKRNLERAAEFIAKAAREGANAVCFPDYFLTSTPTTDLVGKLHAWAEPIPSGESVKRLCAEAKLHSVYVVGGSIVELGEDGKLYATCPFIGPDGNLIAKIRKSHPENAPAKHELGCGITPAWPEYRVFDTDIGRVGIMLDMEGIAVEVPRILEVKGAEIIFWPVNFSSRFPAVPEETACYSGFTHAYVASACGVGWATNVPVHPEGFFGMMRADLIYDGGSTVAFCGGVIAGVPDFMEGLATATVDPEKVRAVRAVRKRIIPLERRPETYGDLVRKID